MKEWFEGRGVDDQPPARSEWVFEVLLLALIILSPVLLDGCASPCERSEEIVTVLAANETHVIQLRGHVEMCPR